MAQHNKRKRSRRSTTDVDALAVAATRMYFEDGWTNEEIGNRLGLHPNAVAAYIRRARDKGLVALRVADPSTPTFATTVELQVEAGYGIRRVVAVKVPPADEAPEDGTSAPDRDLHRHLAIAAAQFVWDRIRDHDKIALGAGRTVRFLVDGLGDLAATRPRSYAGLEVVSLTGNPVVRRDTHDLNSDAIATAFGRVFDVDGAAVHRVDHSYVVEDPHAVMRTTGSRVLAPTWRHDRAPDLAIVGLGVLGPRHHLMAASRGDERLAPVRRILDRLERTILSVCPSAVMDVYDTFWLRDDALPPRLAKSARNLVEELNGRIVAVPRPKLDMAREKILIAGGPSKYDGVLAYARQHVAINFTSTVLITDADTAARLIGELGH